MWDNPLCEGIGTTPPPSVRDLGQPLPLHERCGTAPPSCIRDVGQPLSLPWGGDVGQPLSLPWGGMQDSPSTFHEGCGPTPLLPNPNPQQGMLESQALTLSVLDRQESVTNYCINK
jgi:hypothetical protein